MFVSYESIEHIDNDDGFLQEIVRVMKADGVFIFSTPNRSVTMPGKKLIDSPWNPFHVREYNQTEFEAMLGKYFNSVEMYGQNHYSAWRVSLLEWLGRVLPGHAGGRINSALKLPRFIYDKERHHTVGELCSSSVCEYLVAVCSDIK